MFVQLLPGVRRAAIRILGDAPSADDVAAEAFTRAFVRWDRVRTLPHRDAWVIRVAMNLAVDTARARRRPTPTLGSPEPADPAGIAVDRHSLAPALRRLPRRQRDAILLQSLGGLSEAEIAAVLSIAPGTVKSHLHRARHSLRGQLADRDVKEIFDA
jgi:RNA polymerase sigma factor (sigma-70 family)